MKKSVVNDLLTETKIPQFYEVEQRFAHKSLRPEEISNSLKKSFNESWLKSVIAPGNKIGITVGSRGISNLKLIVKEIANCIKQLGGIPYIIPAMGSHGGAIAEGQKAVIESLGVTEDYTGAAIISSMAVEKIGESKNGLPVYVDKEALKMDSIVVLNRIKPHTDISGNIESGLQKMLAVGLGKQKGAEICHQAGLMFTVPRIEEIAEVILEKLNILCGIAIIENAHDEIYDIKILKKEYIKSEEPKLLIIAKKLIPQILINNIDILIVHYMGKNISGDGMDPNVIGRGILYPKNKDIKIGRILVLNLTPETKGNAVGIGLADYTTQKVFERIDFEEMYPNAITAMAPEGVKIPMILPNDELAIKAAIKLEGKNTYDLRIVWIKDTLHLKRIFASESLLKEIERNDNMRILSGPSPLKFDDYGNLLILAKNGG